MILNSLDRQRRIEPRRVGKSVFVCAGLVALCVCAVVYVCVCLSPWQCVVCHLMIHHQFISSILLVARE